VSVRARRGETNAGDQAGSPSVKLLKTGGEKVGKPYFWGVTKNRFLNLKVTGDLSSNGLPSQQPQASWSPTNPNALRVTLTEEDIRNRFPWDYADLREKLKKPLS
jgi:hypothetical protein